MVRLLIFLTACVVLSACCTKKLCIGADDQEEVRFFGFTKTELDNAYLVYYEQDSDFSTPLDTLWFQPEVVHPLSNGKIVVQVTWNNPTAENLDVTKDWRIQPNSGPAYEFTDFKTAKATCNCITDWYTKLKSYKVNGQKVQKGSIIVER